MRLYIYDSDKLELSPYKAADSFWSRVVICGLSALIVISWLFIFKPIKPPVSGVSQSDSTFIQTKINKFK